MAIDQQARTLLAQSTRWLVGARITNYQFDDAIPKSDDPAIREIYGQFLWLLYCDLREHRLTGSDSLAPAQRDVATRCVLFLKSGLPYPWPTLSRPMSALLTLGNLLTLGLAGRIYFHRLSAAGDMTFWPFLSASQYSAALDSPVYLSGAGANNSFKPTPLRGAA
ncbi:hypothetical protein JGR64_00275 [Luteimonas sp. MC1572]|uniref:hypothetical protein n=2 Tax=Luteimonas sp. MC1572 TaxID=2799325 RepID=UPI00190B1411|nr:hypothetical protein [Luteimonas sp. MC1572]QQO03257.1 hypothetical protein JGR64_00275 [Luteimonas sp. MC1572]